MKRCFWLNENNPIIIVCNFDWIDMNNVSHPVQFVRVDIKDANGDSDDVYMVGKIAAFQIQNLLYIGGLHARHDAIFNNVLCLGECCGNTLQNRLIVDIGFHIGTRKIKI